MFRVMFRVMFGVRVSRSGSGFRVGLQFALYQFALLSEIRVRHKSRLTW